MNQQEFKVNMTISVPEGMILISKTEYESLTNKSKDESKKMGWLKKRFHEKVCQICF